MTPERYQKVKGLFQKALELPPLHRPSYLEHVCSGDDELRQAVETMLQSDTADGSFLDKSPIDPLMKLFEETESAPPPTRVGHYQIIRELGRGGMGAVYLAARADDQYAKQVAIKLVLRDRENAMVLQRFRRERQILANLEHPNIALLFDGGATPEGLPYLVMEYVEGVPIDDHTDKLRLNVTERLKLFLPVCAAVQHAHQNLVIHRDLKPSNILVKKDGSVKLLDFGIAKLVSTEPATVALDKTATAMRLLTPEFASPEQVKGEAITTATDVYQLGVVLYMLLTGHHPYAYKSRAAILQMLLSDEPERPSVAVDRIFEEEQPDGSKIVVRTPELVAAVREGTPARLKKRLQGDLDAVLLKALSKDPAKRYSSVEQLAADIRRHLHGEPLEARGQQVSYRAGKFLQKHRAAAAGIALVTIALIGGIAVAATEAHYARQERTKAERRFQQVRVMANSLLFEVHDAMAPMAGTTAARQLLVKKALQYLDSLSTESSGDPALEQELATAYHRVGDLQGNPNSPNLGDTAAAINSYQKAKTIRESLLAKNTGDIALRRDLAASHEALGDVLLATGDSEAALAGYQQAQTIREELLNAEPSNRPLKSLLAKSYHNVVALLTAKGDTAKAMELCLRALKMSQELAQSDPSNDQARRNLAVAHGRLGGVLDRMGDSVGALQNYEKALEVQQKMASDNPDNAQARRELSVVYEDLGRHFAAGNNVAGATANYQKALAIRTQLSQEDPKNAQAARDLAFIEMNTGEMQEQTNQRAGAVESYRRALAIFQRLAAQDPSNLLARRDLALIFERLGNLQAGAGNATAALEHYRRLQELASEWASKDGSTVALHTLGVAHLKVSEMQSRANDRAAALTSSEAALNIFQKLHQTDQSNTENQRGLAWAWIRKGEALTSSSQKAIEAGKC
jgi:serine/threonine protein kinase